MRKALYPGSFDPITLGHVDVIWRAAQIFDEVLVTIFFNTAKSPLFSLDERVVMTRDAVKSIPNASVDTYEGLLIEYARQKEVNVVIKGLRAVSDFEYEFQMAQMNTRFSPKLETLFMMARPEHSYLSSSIVKELSRFGLNVEPLVPPLVSQMLAQKFRQNAELAKRPFATKDE